MKLVPIDPNPEVGPPRPIRLTVVKSRRTTGGCRFVFGAAVYWIGMRVAALRWIA